MARTYAVVWRSGDSQRRVGKLTIGPDGLQLDGVEPGIEAVRESFACDAIRSVALVRAAGTRLDDSPTVAIVLDDEHEVRLASLDGPGALHEIARRLAQLVSARV